MRRAVLASLPLLVCGLLLTACGDQAPESKPVAGPRGAGSAALPEALQRIRQRGRLVVAHEVGFEPFEYKDPKTGDVVGFDVDLSKELGIELGVPVEFRNVRFDDIGAELTTGRADLIVSGLTVNADRERIYAFSKPYFFTVTALLLSKDKASDVRAPADLDRSGRVVAVQAGTTGVASAAKVFGKAEVRQYKTDEDAVQDVVQGRCDAFLYELAPLRKDHEHNPDATILLEQPITSEPYAVAARLDEPALAKWVDEALAKMRADGRLQRLFERYKPDGRLDAPK